MRAQIAQETVDLECFTDGEVVSGPLRCPAERRLIDVLNDGSGDFLRLVDVAEGERAHPTQSDVFLRKSAIEFAAVSKPDAGRGVGANPVRRQYPFVTKEPVRVSLRLPTFTLTGELHCARGQTVEEVLNGEVQFLPLTAVNIVREHHLYGNRPFVAVNRERIVWSALEPPDPRLAH